MAIEAHLAELESGTKHWKPKLAKHSLTHRRTTWKSRN